MSFSVSSSLTGGIRRATNRNGLLLALAYMIIGGAWQVLFYSAVSTWIPQPGPEATSQTMPLPTIDVPLAISAVGAIALLLALQYMTIVAIRTFVGGYSHSIPTEYYTRNIGFVLVNAIVGSLVFGIAIFLGSLLLVIPGIIAYVAFVFVLLYIAAEDENFISAFSSSWSLTRGHWLRLFALLAVVTITLSIVQFVSATLLQLGITAVSGAGLGTLVSGVVSIPFTLLVLGILAEAFTQLREDRLPAR